MSFLTSFWLSCGVNSRKEISFAVNILKFDLYLLFWVESVAQVRQIIVQILLKFFCNSRLLHHFPIFEHFVLEKVSLINRAIDTSLIM